MGWERGRVGSKKRFALGRHREKFEGRTHGRHRGNFAAERQIPGQPAGTPAADWLRHRTAQTMWKTIRNRPNNVETALKIVQTIRNRVTEDSKEDSADPTFAKEKFWTLGSKHGRHREFGWERGRVVPKFSFANGRHRENFGGRNLGAAGRQAPAGPGPESW